MKTDATFLNETRGIIEKYIIDNFSSAPVVVPDMAYEPTATDAYVAIFVSVSAKKRVDIGGDVWRAVGTVTAQVFAPSGMALRGSDIPYLGQAGALVLADTLSCLLQTQPVDGACFLDPTMQGVGDDGEFWQVNVTVPFWRDSAGSE